MRCLSCFSALCIVLLAGHSLSAAETIQDGTLKLRKDLERIWADYPLERQTIVRDQAINDLNSTFSTDLNKRVGTPGMTVSKAIDTYLANVIAGRQAFRIERNKQTLQAYVNSCGIALRREIQQASDFKTPRTTQEGFDLLVKKMDSARSQLVQAGTEVQTVVYSALASAMDEVIRNAIVPPDLDRVAQMNNNMEEIRRRFPITNPALAKMNQPINQALESTCRRIQQMKPK